MNVAEVYNKYNTQLIIIISGLSGSGKTELANNISKLFKIKMIPKLNKIHKLSIKLKEKIKF
jgi:uridine kinase